MRKRVRTYPMVALLAVTVTALLVCNRFRWPVNLLYQSEYETLDSLQTYAFVLQGEPRPTAKCQRFEAQLLARWDTVSEAWHPTRGRVLLYVRRDSSRMCNAADTLITRTRIRRGPSIGRFDYGLYLRRQGIIGTAYVWRYQTLSSSVRHEPSLQQRLYRRLAASGLEGDELATAGALTLGYKEDLDPQLKRHFQAAGAAHVLAVSGLHTGILYALLVGLLTLGGRVRPRYENRLGRCLLSGMVIACLWGYAWLTGLSPSVVRCVVMLTIVEVGRMVYRQAVSLNTVAAAALLMLYVRPLDLWNVGFQLSFTATAAIILFARDAEWLLHSRDRETNWSDKLKAWLVGTVIITFAAQFGTLPITMYTFGQVSNYFLLTNLIVLPLASLIVPFGLAGALLGGTWLGRIAGYVTSGAAWLMNHSVGWIESLPGSTTAVRIDGWMVLLLYTALAAGYLSLHPLTFDANRSPRVRLILGLLIVFASLFTFCVLYTQL